MSVSMWAQYILAPDAEWKLITWLFHVTFGICGSEAGKLDYI